MSEAEAKAKVKHFINILDYDAETISALIDFAIAQKKLLAAAKLPRYLEGKTVAVYSEKPTLRTRVSFEVGVVQLGGYAIPLTKSEIGLGTREPAKDIARIVSRLCDGFVTRTYSHSVVEELAEYSSIPVINALTDYSHPCQAMADLMTAREHFGTLDGLKLTYIGDGNNVTRSLAAVCARLGVEMAVAAPVGYQLDDTFVKLLLDAERDVKFTQIDDPREAIADADIVYTDTWISMGQEDDRQERIDAFRGYQVDADLMKLARKTAIVMHCLPAYRGYEISDEVMESEQSVVFDEAENRLHFQRALMATLIGGAEIR